MLQIYNKMCLINSNAPVATAQNIFFFVFFFFFCIKVTVIDPDAISKGFINWASKQKYEVSVFLMTKIKAFS